MGSYIHNEARASAGGVGFCGLLFIAFLVLKLTHVIDWSWWWITAPLWGPFVLVILGTLITWLAIIFLKK